MKTERNAELNFQAANDIIKSNISNMYNIKLTVNSLGLKYETLK